jgi:hypothetical protein
MVGHQSIDQMPAQRCTDRVELDGAASYADDTLDAV